MRIVQRVALGLIGVTVLIGVGAVALTIGSQTAAPPAQHAAPVLADRASERAAMDDLATASIAPAGDAEAQVTPAAVSQPQRVGKSDRLNLESRHKLAALRRQIEPSGPIVATRQKVARAAPRTSPVSEARSSGTQAAPVQQSRQPAPAATEPQAEPPSAIGKQKQATAHEAETAALGEAVSRALGEPDTASEPEPEPEPKAATRMAPVLDHVNMRAGPDNGAAVITVVPNGSRVEVIDCDYWCEVNFSGKRGWIYKSFIRGAS